MNVDMVMVTEITQPMLLKRRLFCFGAVPDYAIKRTATKCRVKMVKLT